MNEDTVLIEKNKPFSQSALWACSKKFYKEQGLLAWDSQVPYYATSSLHHAHCHAQYVFNYIKDVTAASPKESDDFYILEIGAGQGKFAFHMLKELKAMYDAENKPYDFKYIISDIAQKTLNRLQKLNSFKEFIDDNLLDFCQFDATKDQTFDLIQSGARLDGQLTKRPLIVIGNYLFDTLPTDLFHVKGDQLSECQVNIRTEEDNIENKWPVTLSRLDIKFSQKQIKDETYYNQTLLDQILFDYKKTQKDCYVSVPVSGLRLLDTLNKITDSNYVFLLNDKGHADTESLETFQAPLPTFHGSFSVMVNFDFIRKYVESNGAQVYSNHPYNRFGTMIINQSAHKDSQKLPLTQSTLLRHFEYYSPAHFNAEVTQIIMGKTVAQDLSVISILKTSRFDPALITELQYKIIQLINDGNHEIKQLILNHLDQIIDNIYALKELPNHYFSVGHLLFVLGQKKRAISFLKLSLKIYGEDYQTKELLAKLYSETDQIEAAEQITSTMSKVSVDALESWASRCYRYVTRDTKTLITTIFGIAIIVGLVATIL